MTTTHFVDGQGKYLGGFGDGAEPPTGSIEVPAPTHGFDTWDGTAWNTPVPSTDPRDYPLTKRQWFWLADANGLAGHLDTIAASLKADPDLIPYANFRSTLKSDSFDFDKTLAEMDLFAPLLPAGSLPDEAALTPMWMAAAQT